MVAFALPSDEELRELLNMDAGLIAEKITGKSYKECKETQGLMMALHFKLAELKRETMKEMGDVYWGCSLDHALKVALAEGFVEIARWDVPRYKYGSVEVESTDYCILMHSPEGFYLTLESYGKKYVGEGKGVNGTSYSDEDGLNTIELTYNLELDPALAARVMEEGYLRDEWFVRHKTDFMTARDSEDDPEPKILTKEEDDLYSTFFSVQGNVSWNDDAGEIILACASCDCRHGLSLILREIRKETSWKICKKLKVWEWREGIHHAPYGPRHLEDEKLYDTDFVKNLHKDAQEWLAFQLTLMGDEHQYLADVPVKFDRGRSSDVVAKKKGKSDD